MKAAKAKPAKKASAVAKQASADIEIRGAQGGGLGGESISSAFRFENALASCFGVELVARPALPAEEIGESFKTL